MLLFQKDWNHILERCIRAGIEPEWLIAIVAEINLYLPDDWRLTRSRDNFSIQIVSGKQLKLVGRSFRIDKNRIIKIIDSVFLTEYFDKFDLQASTGNLKGTVDERIKAEHPEIINPNLYFFKPPPDNSISPLFARQYEKVKMVKKGEEFKPGKIEYHRIHPLTKAGLDTEHFRWIKRDSNGHVEFVDTVDAEFHGKDYWVIKDLKWEKQRGNYESYLKAYDEILHQYNVMPPLNPPRPETGYETEYKLLITGDQDNAESIFELIRECVGEKGLLISSEKGPKEQVDIYLDDENLTLYSNGVSFRLREGVDNPRVTLKRRLPIAMYSQEGLYERVEEEAIITKTQKNDLASGKPINVLPYRLIQYVAPYCKGLKPRIKVINKRKVLILEDSDHRKADLCFDNVRYVIKGREYGPYFEVEIESKGIPKDTLKELANYIVANLGLIVSEQSKYERGISLSRTAVIQKRKRHVIIDTDCGVDDALALILAFKSPELDVKAVTTVSGNVHVDKVVKNVFKVFKALNLCTIPLVAKGADHPLKKDPIIADSVHGTDGLGDAVAEPNDVSIDARPAWKVICDLAKEHPKEITLITLGPITNLALAIQNDPDAVHCLKNVVAMGGVFFDVGNIGADAEFNVAADPDAAYEVVKFCRDLCLKIPVDEYGKEVILPPNPTRADYEKIKDYTPHDPNDPRMVPLTFVGLDVTHKVLLRRAIIERTVTGNPEKSLLTFIRDITKKYMDFYYENEWLPGCYLHDPLAIAHVVNPAFLDIEKHIIRVETKGEFTNGVIFPDDRPTRNPAWRNPAEEVIGIARKVEREAFEEFFLRRLVED